MNGKKFTLEYGLYILIFLFGISVRLVGLGVTPLGDGEAKWALQAMELTQGQQPVIGAQPGYVVLTSGLFFLFGTSDALARLIPALAGSLLVLSPLLFRRYLGKTGGLLLAFGLALSPTMAAASRVAGGPALGLSMAVLAVGFYLNRKPALTGICAGLALLGGASLWTGALAGILCGLAVHYFKLSPLSSPEPTEQGFNWKLGLGWLAGIVAGIGIFLFLGSGGLGGLAGGLTDYIQGWGRAQGMEFFQVILALLFYEPLVSILTLVFIFRFFFSNDDLDKGLLLWWLISLVLVLAYPSRQAMDLGWVVLPMLAMAAKTIASFIKSPVDNREMALVTGVGVGVILVSMWWMFIFIQLSYLPPEDGELIKRSILLLIEVIVLLLGSVLIGFGWSWQVVKKGWQIGGGIVLLIYMISAMWNSTNMGGNPGAELWRTDAYPSDERMISDTLSETARWKVGFGTELDVAVIGEAPSSLRWTLRNYHVIYTDYLPAESNPSVVFTFSEENFHPQDAYRGQDFVQGAKPAWPLFSAKEWVRWLELRITPVEKSMVYMWVRRDIFPGGQNTTP